MTNRQGTSLGDLLGSVAKKMLADFEASGAVQHRGSKGTIREANLLNNYLAKYLPRSVVAVHSGEAISVDGEVSAQTDIMILDPSTPPFWDEDDYRIVPIECVHGVIEVKSFLDSAQLRDAWGKIAGIKRMPKKAIRPSVGFQRSRSVYGKSWSYIPTSGFVFAYDGSDLKTLGTTMVELANAEGDNHPEFYIDSVWILSKGGLVWRNPGNGGIDPAPEPHGSLASVNANPGQVLMSLTQHLYAHFGNAWAVDLEIGDYFGDTSLGSGGFIWDYEPDDEVDQGSIG